MVECQIKLSLSGTPDERASSLLLDLRRHLASIGLEAVVVDGAPLPGARGDVALAGQLALGLISSGSVVALIGCLRAYIEREKKLVIDIEGMAGQRVTVRADNVDEDELQSLLQALTSRGGER
jgi:hypothetical protein